MSSLLITTVFLVLIISSIDTRASSLPTLLQVPLIKTSNGEIHGIQSGRRSALLKLDGRWYRAKGCGDLYEGFPVAPVDTSPPSGAQNIRGCTFEHTSSRELKMTEVIQDALEPYGIQACNKSVGKRYFFDFGLTSPRLVGVQIQRRQISSSEENMYAL